MSEPIVITGGSRTPGTTLIHPSADGGGFNPAAFVSTWTTTGTPESVTLPTISGGSYNFVVDWGDGTAPDTITAFDDADRIHSYATPGTYTMVITGTCDRWNFNTVSASAALIKTIVQWGTVGWATMLSAFRGCTGLTSVPAGTGTSSVTSMNSMFFGCTSLTSVGLFSTGSVTSFASAFAGATALTTVPQFNTAAVTTFSSTFNGCTSLTSVPALTCTAATTMANMFSGATALTTVDLTVDSSLVTTTTMFATTGAITSCVINGIVVSFNIASNQLGSAALDALYTSLGSASATITVTGNPGLSGDDPTIATAKGWTVTE